jgi:hypothetical protein
LQQLEWNVQTITEETDKLYDRIVAKGGRDKLTLTREKIIEARGWQPSLYLTKDNFERALTELGCYYVPKVMQPGPAFVFPVIDIDRKRQYAQTKPLDGSVLCGKSKYRFIGSKGLGPTWLGNTDETIKAVVHTGQVVLVEGLFDLLACWVLAPEVPVMSPLTKRLGKEHQAYIRMLGLRRLYLMFDNELPSAGNSIGAGNLAMRQHSKELSRYFDVRMLLCPACDPSEALKNGHTAAKLRAILRSVVRHPVSSVS